MLSAPATIQRKINKISRHKLKERRKKTIFNQTARKMPKSHVALKAPSIGRIEQQMVSKRRTI